MSSSQRHPKNHNLAMGVITKVMQDFVLLFNGENRFPKIALWPIKAWQIVLSILLLALLWLVLVFYVDAPITHWTRALDPEFRSFARRFTDLGKSDIYLGLSAVIMIAMAAIRARSVDTNILRAARRINAFAAYWFVCVAGSGLVVIVIKQFIGRARPKHFDEYGHLFFDPFTFDASFAGFPSGHATTSFALVAVATILLPRLASIVLIAGTSLALTRVLVGAHYFSDVIFGAILAFAFCLYIRRVFARRGWLFLENTDGNLIVGNKFFANLSMLVSLMKSPSK